MAPVTLWMVRAGQHGEGENDALNGHVVGIGWPELGDLTQVGSAANLHLRLEVAYPDAKPSILASWGGQIDAFRFQLQIGDLVALPLRSAPAVAFGRVTGDYRYAPDAGATLRHQRPVEWIADGISRDRIDPDLLGLFGATLTVGRISGIEAEPRIERLLATPPAPEPGGALPTPAVFDPADTADAALDAGQIGRDQIRRRIAARFPGQELTRLIGELLTANGYTCSASAPGPDGGGDILASPGRLGFDGVPLAVQVKSGSAPVDIPALRQLKDLMGNYGAQRGLLVSWGGFTKTTRQEARRLFFEVRLWDSDAVIDKLQDVYDRLPASVRAELPLHRVWAPLPDDD